jgi:SAM-dependent methyltransferase
LQTYYPQNYWFSTDGDTASRLEEAYRRFVLRDHVAFVTAAFRGLAAPAPVLDVGCGGGLFSRMLSERGFTAYGLDYSAQAARVAWIRNEVPAVCGELSAAPFAPGSFAAITMFHVLEHLYDPASYLQAAHRLLRPGGKLIVQVPNAASWQFLLFGENWNGLDVPRHLLDFRARDLDSLIEDCGFEILRHKHFSLRDNPAGLATSIAPALDPMARRIRAVRESGNARLLKDLIYLALVITAVPVTALEAACRAGSTIMVEARKKG